MEFGQLVEYIDRQKILCAVVTEVNPPRLRLLNENDREVNLSENRLVHRSGSRLDLSLGRTRTVDLLKESSRRRDALVAQIDIRELWEVLNTEQEWIDLATMTAFCFPNNPTDDHESAVLRAFFRNRKYFKFNADSFFPHTPEQVQAIILREQEQARRNQMIQEAGEWLQTVLEGKIVSAPPDAQKYIDILRSCFLFEKESPHWELGRAVMSRAGITDNETVFDFLTRVGVWSETENTDLYRFKIPVEFSEPVLEAAQNLLRRSKPPADDRRDLTGMDLMTIDGQATLDFDDALSIEKTGDNYLLGVHIADVGHFIQKNDPIDQEARTRGSSIYMPDCRIPMVPSVLAEDQMSLKAGKVRPAISLMVRLTPQAEVLDYEIFPSLIRIRRQLTYYEVNLTSDIDPKIIALHRLAESFRKSRIQKDAVHISLPEINIWIDEDGELVLSRVNRESPGRMLVSEMMILANWLMARFLSDRQMPAIFRSQPAPRDRLFKGISDDLFQNWMQRKLLNRFLLSRNAEPHSGLGLDAYTTATSPIRKYSDLITQRQIRAALGLESPYTDEEVDRIIQMLEEPVNAVGRIQYSRHRFWLLKRLESRKGEKEPALVLARRRNGYSVLLTDYMIECDLAVPANISLRPEDLIRVVVQHVDARKDKISVYLN